MEIQRLPLCQLMPAPYNPRVRLRPGDQAYERLARSLDEFDLVQPLVWNRRTGHVVGGHQRLEVLRSRGVSEVECVVVDLPLAREHPEWVGDARLEPGVEIRGDAAALEPLPGHRSASAAGRVASAMRSPGSTSSPR